jgi:hypothetical protein
MTKQELTALEVKIRAGLASFVEVGTALRAIKERNGFKLRGFKTFDEYCQSTFQFSERNGYRMIAAAETAEKVEKAIGDRPRNEFAARVLGRVAHDPKLIERVKERLARQGATIATASAEKIEDVVKRVLPATRPMFAGPEPEPEIPGLSDECPNCKAVPDAYRHADSTWRCGACDAPVRVGVVAARTVVCGECGAVITSTLGFCQSCGVAVGG